MPPGFDFPTNPALGTVVTVPDGSYRVWDSQKWRAAPSAAVVVPPGSFLPLAGGTITGPVNFFNDPALGIGAQFIFNRSWVWGGLAVTQLTSRCGSPTP